MPKALAASRGRKGKGVTAPSLGIIEKLLGLVAAPCGSHPNRRSSLKNFLQMAKVLPNWQIDMDLRQIVRAYRTREYTRACICSLLRHQEAACCCFSATYRVSVFFQNDLLPP